MLKLSENKVPIEIMLLASMVDDLALLVWSKTKNAEKGQKRPKSILKELLNTKEDELISFESSEEFNRAREKIIKKGGI